MLSYGDALAFVLSLTDLERRTDLTGARAELGLKRMERLLRLLGHPERSYWTVHVAGTKGKGSTAAMIDSVLRATGLRSGLYTSPHLHTFRERIRLHGRAISPHSFAALATELRPLVEGMADRPSTFETATALAMLHFARVHADCAVFEVGMGGRLDATNVIVPRVSVITSISYDHMAVLGNTLTAIAREKAGIVKAGIPTVSAPQQPEALAVITETCWRQGSPLTLVGRDLHVSIQRASTHGQRLTITGDSYSHNVYLPLAGAHQAENAAVAVAALEVLRRQGIGIQPAAIAQGLRRVRWPGRLEILAHAPTILVDGAHNVDSAQKLRAALDQFYPARPRVMIIGTSADKDSPGIMQALASGADTVIVTRAPHPRAAALPPLQAAAAAHTADVRAIASVPAALAEACRLAGSRGTICATGSLFIVAEVRALVKGLPQEQTPAAG